MLTIISGPARTGKTRRVLDAIQNSRWEGMILITPEQLSHETERALAAQCGAEVNLRAEVLSFTRLCSRVFTQLGGAADTVPDRGSKLMLMSLAVSAVAEKLKVYGSRERRGDFLESLLDARDELARTMTDASRLSELAAAAGGSIGEKLSDLSLICAAFDALLSRSLPDPRERLERAAELIPESSIGEGGVFVDGFTDFTALELNVLDAFMLRGGDITVTLCRDGTDSMHFRIANVTFARLIKMAGERAVPVKTLTTGYADTSRADALRSLCENLFDYSAPTCDQASAACQAVAADSIFTECQLAAARVLRWMKDDASLRWSDIAVAARDFGRYESVARSAFELYGVPVYTDAPRRPIESGLFRLTLSALDTVTGSWRREDVFRCLKTGLAGLSPNECGELENYCITWNIRGESAWRRPGGWRMSPRGYGQFDPEDDAEALERINALRDRAAAPLLKLADDLRSTVTAGTFASAIYDYFDALSLNELFTKRCEELRRAGKSAEAVETAGLWEEMIASLEQFYTSLVGMDFAPDEAVKLFELLLSCRSAGAIPASLDSVSLGELTRLRARHVKKLIILGAGESSLPMISSAPGVFSREERAALSRLGLELSAAPDEELCREFSDIYLTVSSASENLYLSWNAGDGAESFLVRRMETLCGTQVQSGAALLPRAACEASEPLLRLAVSGSASPEARAARELAGELWGGVYEDITGAVNAPRGTLGEHSVRELYGKDFNITASRAEKFSVCRYAYFMHYGLRARERPSSAIDAPEFGNFVHYVLENTVRDVKSRGGFKTLKQGECEKIAEDWVTEYIGTVMHGFEGKSGRFVYLFSRLKGTVMKIASDIADELSVSDFEPLDFELEFSRRGELPPITVDCGDELLNLEGKVDRVDGWIHNDSLYLRVADYKTGRTSFSLTDVWYGSGIQMLIYLFALENEGSQRYGRKIVPAGVLYAPARDVLLSMPRSSTPDEIAAERRKVLRRSGLILDDPEVVGAMENGDSPCRIPVTFKNGRAVGSLAGTEQLGRLANYVRRLLQEMGRGIACGDISANPLRSPAQDPCAFCEFASACDFRDGVDAARIKRSIPDAEFWEKI